MISPLTIATQGLLNSPLAVAAVRGHLSIDVAPPATKPGGGGSKGKRGLQDPREYTVTPKKLKDMKEGQVKREEEEIVAVVVAVMDVIQ